MEIFYIVVLFLLFCFTSFAFTYSCDEAKIWGELRERPPIWMPRFKDIEEEIDEKRHKEYNWSLIDTIQKYVDESILPAAKYFSLLNEIERYQKISDGSIFLQLLWLPGAFSVYISIILVNTEIIESLILSCIIVMIVCIFTSILISVVYEKINKLRIKSFCSYEYDENFPKRLKQETDNVRKAQINTSFIYTHYEYLNRIKNTVIFRSNLRKALNILIIILFLAAGCMVPEIV